MMNARLGELSRLNSTVYVYTLSITPLSDQVDSWL